MKTREEFLRLLDNARAVQWTVAEYLTRQGAKCRLIPATTTPDEESRFDHTDEGDIEIVMRVEVKHWPDADFRSLDDVSYPNIIVDEARALARNPKATLYGYMIVNATRTGALVIPRSTRGHWFDRTMKDKREPGMMRTYTLCPREHVRYVEL